MAEKGAVPENFVPSIPKPKLNCPLPRRLREEQAEALLLAVRNLPRRSRFERARDYALVALMLFAGLRKAEACKLRAADVDLAERCVYVSQ